MEENGFEPPPVAHQVAGTARLRAAVHAALREGRELCREQPQHMGKVLPMLQRLEQIRAELDRMHGLRGAPYPAKTRPISID